MVLLKKTPLSVNGDSGGGRSSLTRRLIPAAAAAFAGKSREKPKLWQEPAVRRAVTQGHIGPSRQLPAPHTSGLPLLGQNTAQAGAAASAALVNELPERAEVERRRLEGQRF